MDRRISQRNRSQAPTSRLGCPDAAAPAPAQNRRHTRSPAPQPAAGEWLLLLLLVLSAPLALTAQIQLPPGTTDTTTASAPDLLRTQAADALTQQDYPTARKLLTTLAERNPKDATILYNLGLTDEALNDEPAAAEAYRKSTAADPNSLDPHLALGLLLARQGKLAEAHTELTTAVALNPPDTPEPALKARAYRALARLDATTDPAAASADLLAALKLSPETPDDALLAGELAEASHDPAAAETAYRRALTSQPRDPALTAALAHLLLSLKRAPEAETLLAAALAQHPGDTTLTSQFAAADAAQGKSAEALALIEQLHTATPASPAVTLLLAHLYSDAKKDDKAAPLYIQLLAASPDDPHLVADLGTAQLHLHNYPEAERLLQQALKDPRAFANPADLGSTVEALAFAASHNNDPQTVLQALSQRATVSPPSPLSLFLGATAHDTLHHPKEASALYKEFLATAAGKFPDQEWEARHRLLALEHRK